MAKVFNVTAPRSMALHKLSQREIAKEVEKASREALDNLPEGQAPIGINAVVLNQTMKPQGGDFGGWAEWTRACCGSRDRIEEFSDPVVDEISLPGTILNRKHGEQHFETQLKIVEFESPEHVAE